METNALGIAIITVNFIILAIIIKTMTYSCRKCYLKEGSDFDYNFYMIIFLSSTLLFIANCMALYTSIQTYGHHRVVITDDITLARYVDRVSMMFAYLGLDLLSVKYVRLWFKKD